MAGEGSDGIAVHDFTQTPMYRYSKPDVTLVAGDEEFKAHESVLASQSDFFRALFGSGLKESQARHIQLQEIPPDDLLVVLDWLYRAPTKSPLGETPSSAFTAESKQRFAGLMKAFSFLQIAGAAMDFCRFFEDTIHQITKNNALLQLDQTSHALALINEVFKAKGHITTDSLNGYIWLVANNSGTGDNSHLVKAMRDVEDPDGIFFQRISLALLESLSNAQKKCMTFTPRRTY